MEANEEKIFNLNSNLTTRFISELS